MRRKPMRMRKQRNFLKRSGHPLINVKKKRKKKEEDLSNFETVATRTYKLEGKPVTVRHADP